MFRRQRRGTSSLGFPIPECSTYLGEGSALTGQLHFREDVRVDGRVEGEIRAEGVLVIGETAVVDATVIGDAVIVLGEVEGDVRARVRAVLHKGARVTGDVAAGEIVVEQGAQFRGSIVIAPDAAPALGDGLAHEVPALDARVDD